jgi:hypothetical protein
MTKAQLEKRARDAASLFRLIDNIWNSLDKVPSFTGKARFMDRVLNVRTHAHNLRVGFATGPRLL